MKYADKMITLLTTYLSSKSYIRNCLLHLGTATIAAFGNDKLRITTRYINPC